METIVSAYGLLLAVLGVLYGLWHPEIASALSVDTSINPLDAAPVREAVAEALWHKALPLAVASAVLGCLLVPPAISVVLETSKAITMGSAFALDRYDAVRAFLLAVELFAAYRGAQAVRTSLHLGEVRRLLKR